MSSQPFYWARVKPYNKKRGHVVQRIVAMGQLWTGGSGLPPEPIPVWVKVNAAQAKMLSKFKQLDNDIYSKRVFDTVTEAQRRDIDRAEEEFRRARIGLGQQSSIAELPNVSARSADATRQDSEMLNDAGGRITMQDLQNASAPVATSESFLADDDDQDEIGSVTDMGHVTQTTSAVVAQEQDVAGRSDAVDGFDEPAPTPVLTPLPTTAIPAPARGKLKGRRTSKKSAK